MAMFRTSPFAVPIIIAGMSILIVLVAGVLMKDRPTEPWAWSEVVAFIRDGDLQAAKRRIEAGHGLKARDADFLLGMIHLTEFSKLHDVDVAHDHLETAVRLGSDKARLLLALQLAKFDADAERSDVWNDLDRALHILSKIEEPSNRFVDYLRTFARAAQRDVRPAWAGAVRLVDGPDLPPANWVAALAYRTGVAEPVSYKAVITGLREDAARGRALSQLFLAIELVGEFCKRHTRPGAPVNYLPDGLRWAAIAAKQGSKPGQNLLRWCKRTHSEGLLRTAELEAETWFATELQSDASLLARAASWCGDTDSGGLNACVLQAVEHDEKCRDPWQLLLDTGDLRSTALYDRCRRYYSERSHDTK